MHEVTHLLSAIEQGDPHATEQLLPLVYDELRRLAASRLAREKPGQTLDATALVHEAYLRLIGDDPDKSWYGRQLDFRGTEPTVGDPHLGDILAVHEALTQFAAKHPGQAELVKLRYFAGLTIADAAAVLGISSATAERHWRYARAWLARRLRNGNDPAS